uniref:Uncharacterized protein n=1 Tax=Caenorhabditis tropicalis TaxID=1561998 RepID=A0A1I7UTQ2_9PELO
MEFREKFLISLMSKWANKTLKMTAVPSELSFQLASILFIHSEPYDPLYIIRESKVNDEASFCESGKPTIGCAYMRMNAGRDKENKEKVFVFYNCLLG